jgi:hypothetical protein
MPVETAADRLAFVNSDEFACEVSYTPVGGGPARAIAGIFDSDYLAIDVGGEVEAATRHPRISCRVDDLTLGGKEDDSFVITAGQLEAAGLDVKGAGTYLVKLVQPDGTGFADLTLERQ